MPTGPFGANGAIPGDASAEGALVSRPPGGIRPADLATARSDAARCAPMMLARGLYPVLFECRNRRIAAALTSVMPSAVLPEPDMHVDLGDFRYLAAKRIGPHGDEYVSLVVSRSQDNGFVQVTQVGQLAQPAPRFTASTKTPLAAPADQQALSLPAKPVGSDLAGLLAQGQPQVLEDLVFPSGSADLAEGDYASLQALADWLKANPDQSVTLVGHTDNDGSLAGNIAVSKKRAASVRQALLARYDIAADQVQAEGVGYLAPRDSNLTDEGRQKNRRVEVMLTSTK